MSGAAVKHVMKRVPLIKFPQRHPKPSGSAPPPQVSKTPTGANKSFFSKSAAPTAVGGKASLQPKRTPVTEKEIEAVMLGGSI